MSLGGMHDEAELRGHRRTYIGALPGRLIQAMRRAGTAKSGTDAGRSRQARVAISARSRGGITRSVWIRNRIRLFRDNYLDLPFDLSKVLFITTANSLDTIPAPLLDRMEILRLSDTAKKRRRSIARRYLLPRQLIQDRPLDGDNARSPTSALIKIISSYTREAGVRRSGAGAGTRDPQDRAALCRRCRGSVSK
jgi:ATP-dependent Lon protease